MGKTHYREVKEIEFQSFIWWSMAFEFYLSSIFLLLSSQFQSFIWWSMAFEY